MGKSLFIATLTVLLSVVLLGQQAGKDTKNSSETLRSYADKMDLLLGTVIQGKFWSDPRYTATLGAEFNSGASMELFHHTEPQRGQFDFKNMDQEIQFAKDHNMKLFGVAMIYRNDTAPPWLQFQSGCGKFSPVELDQILKNHIQTLIHHGGDTFYGWEVVNEPLDPAHNGCWTKVFGEEELIAKAYRYAREASANTLLLLNESFGRQGIDRPRVDQYFSLLKRLKSQGVPIDAAGIEMHLEAHQIRSDYVNEFKYFLEQAAKAKVQAHITEMDVYQGPSGNFDKQKEIYHNILHACLKDSNCKGFTVWGISDTNAWKPIFKNLSDTKPLLFDENYGKKSAYDGVLQALKEGR